MEKGFEVFNDTKLDTKGDWGNSTADFGGELSKDEGFDLNADLSADNLQKNVDKTGLGTRIGAIAQLPIAAFGGKQYDDGMFKPNAQIEAGELDNALRGPGYADYTDAPSPPNIQLLEGYTSNINELMGDENISVDTEAESDAYWQERINAFNQYEAEQTEINEQLNDE